MRKQWIGAVIAANALWAVPAFAGAKISGPFTHEGMCEASGAVALPASGANGPAFLVANDEDNVLRVFASERNGPALPVTEADLNKFLHLDPADEDDKADLEAVTQVGDRIYIIGSHSRSGSKGKIREARHQLFSVTARPLQSGGIAVSPTSKEAAHSLLDALVALHPDFRAAVRPDVEEDKALIPEVAGLNIEALAGRPDGTMFIGLRNPLSKKSEAWVVPFENPAEVVDKGAAPRLGTPIALDLGNRGIRSMEYSPSEQVYYVMAGAAGTGGNFELYRWSGKAGEPPVAVADTEKAIADAKFQPEAMIVDGRRLHLLSDDGDRVMGGGKTCKDSKLAERAFRSFILTLD